MATPMGDPPSPSILVGSLFLVSATLLLSFLEKDLTVLEEDLDITSQR
jgi:hypothetical protein